MVRGDIRTHVATHIVNKTLKEWGFDLLTLSLWQIDSYQFSIIFSKNNKRSKEMPYTGLIEKCEL